MYLVSRLEKEILVVWIVDYPIFVTVKKSQSDIFSAGISQSTIISWPLVVKTQKSQGVVVVLLRREWCPVFSDSVHLYHSDPSSRLLTERRILCLHLIKKFLKVEGGDTAQHVPTCLVKPFWLGIDSDQSFIGSQRKLATPIAFFNEWHHQQCVHYRTAVRSSFKKFMDCFLVCQKPWKFNTSAEKDFLCILTL